MRLSKRRALALQQDPFLCVFIGGLGLRVYKGLGFRA